MDIIILRLFASSIVPVLTLLLFVRKYIHNSLVIA